MTRPVALIDTGESVPLLVPDMPSPKALLPWLEKMHASRHYSNFGPLVQALEAELAQLFLLPKEQLSTVANATLGLELVLQALALPRHSRVLLPAFTFVATATAVIRAGLIPVFCDVDPDCWMLTPEIARNACAEMRIDAVLPVATFGMPHDMHAWHRFEKDTGLPVVVDAAAAYGSQWLKNAEGTLVFSFHTTKSLPAGEGGLVVSTRPGLVEKIRRLSNFGINLNASVTLQVGMLADIGTNSKMSEYHAAVALASLQIWDSHAQQRRALQSEMRHELDRVTGCNLAWQAAGPGGNLMAPTLLCAQLANETQRAVLEEACLVERIQTRRWYQPLIHQMPVLRSQCMVLEMPHAIKLAKTLLGLPFFLSMTPRQRQRIYACFQACEREWSMKA